MKLASLFTIYILISSYGLYKIKSSAEIFNIPFIIGLSFYILGFLIWLYILRITPLSVAFPVAAGLLILATSLTGIFFLEESFNSTKIAGALLITGGITLISLSTNGN